MAYRDRAVTRRAPARADPGPLAGAASRRGLSPSDRPMNNQAPSQPGSGPTRPGPGPGPGRQTRSPESRAHGLRLTDHHDDYESDHRIPILSSSYPGD